MDEIVGYFPATLAIDSVTGTRLKNAEAQVFAIADNTFTTPLPITDIAGVPMSGNLLTSNSDGIYPEFKPPAGVMQVIVKSGTALTPMTSIAAQAEAAVQAATDAAGSALTATTAASQAVNAANLAASVSPRVETLDGTVIPGARPVIVVNSDGDIANITIEEE